MEIPDQPDAIRRAAVGLRDRADALAEVGAEARARTASLTGMSASYDAYSPIASSLARAGRIATAYRRVTKVTSRE